MNVQTTPSVGSNNQASSSSLVRLTIAENSSITMLPLRQQSNYELLGYPEQSYRTFSKRGMPYSLEVMKSMPQQKYHGSMLIISTIHPQNGQNYSIDGNLMPLMH